MKLTALFGLAVVLGVVGPLTSASADTTSTATIVFTSPATDGITMASPASLSGSVQRPQGDVDSINVTVRWTDTVNRPAAGHPTQASATSPPTRGSYASWSFTPQPAANGRYTATVVATTHSGSSPSEQATASRSFVLDVKPATPADFKESTDAGQRTAHMTWTANSEPDLVGYEVFRSGPGPTDQPKVIAGVLTPQRDYYDTGVATQPPGTYRYYVVAVRQSGDGTKADVSDPTPGADATFTTPAKAVAPPTPTTTAGVPTTGAPAGSRAGASTPNLVLPAPAFTPLSDYQRLLNQAQASTVTTEPPDPGFNPKLPYQPKTSGEVVQVPGVALESGTLGAADNSQGVRRTVEFVAGALVLAVLALFGLVLKRAAEQGTELEALEPAPTVAGRPPATPPLGPSLMLTIVRPATPDPTPLER